VVLERIGGVTHTGIWRGAASNREHDDLGLRTAWTYYYRPKRKVRDDNTRPKRQWVSQGLLIRSAVRTASELRSANVQRLDDRGGHAAGDGAVYEEML